jgi:choline dehydrogenase
MDGYDVLIVGAGSAGGVIAERLSADPDRQILLIEAGPDFPREHEQPPAFLTGGTLVGEGLAGAGAPIPDLDWNFESEPMSSGRRVPLTRGKLVGGSGMINGCVFVRGRPVDYDAWAERGADGWDWQGMLPFLERVEAEIPTRTYDHDHLGPFQQAFLAGWQAVGYRWADDFNSPEAWDGVVGHWPQNRRNELRLGSLVTYLRRARSRPNLTIADRTVVDRVLLDGTRARGVRCADGRKIVADTVVLAGGAYGSPPVLLRSGIGPADELRALGIEPVTDLPVGRGLMEHPQTLFPVSLPPAMARLMVPWYAVAARGPGFWSFPLASDEVAGRGYLSIGLATEDLRGRITLASAAPLTPPKIAHPYETAIEERAFEPGWNALHELLATDAMADVRLVDEGRPLPEILRERLATAYHPMGGCSIGSVVSSDLAVLGHSGLYVADASVFPGQITNNPNLTCFAVGERLAEGLINS